MAVYLMIKKEIKRKILGEVTYIPSTLLHTWGIEKNAVKGIYEDKKNSE